MNDARSCDGPPVVVIGAGAVGIACACFLQQDGRQVLVLDPGGPGETDELAGRRGAVGGRRVAVEVDLQGHKQRRPRRRSSGAVG